MHFFHLFLTQMAPTRHHFQTVAARPSEICAWCQLHKRCVRRPKSRAAPRGWCADDKRQKKNMTNGRPTFFFSTHNGFVSVGFFFLLLLMFFVSLVSGRL